MNDELLNLITVLFGASDCWQFDRHSKKMVTDSKENNKDPCAPVAQ